MKYCWIFLFICTACASTNVTKLNDKKFPEKPANCEIEVRNSFPTDRKYTEIANITRQGGKTRFHTQSLEGFLPDMKEQACKLGADSLVLKNVNEGGFWSSGQASSVAIKYKE